MAERGGPGQRLLDLWVRLRRYPGGTWLYSRILGFAVPYSSTIKARVVQLAPGHARISIRDRRKLRNHLGSVHAIALANVAELATGLAVNCGLPADARGILVSLDVSYEKKARGPLTAECRCEVPPVHEDHDVDAEAEVRNATGEVVARATARWKLGPVPR